MNDLENIVCRTVKKYQMIESGDAIVLGVSGGPDSIAMLHIFSKYHKEWNIQIYVAHIHHGLRENATKDEMYLQEFCKKYDIPLFVKHAKIKEVAQSQKIGIEEAGRKIRYDFFSEVMKQVNANKIAIAHNQNDHVETMIMNCLRGCGINGLKGILEKNGLYIRPLIKASRKEIEGYCKEEKLNPRHDESNDENIYTRNKIRNLVIPYIQKEFNPNIIETMTRLSEIVKEEMEYLDKVAQKSYQEIQEKSVDLEKQKEKKENEKQVCDEGKMATIILNLRQFNCLDIVLRKRICLLAIADTIGDTLGIEKIHIDDVIKLCQNNIGNKYIMPNKRIKVFVKKNKIYFIKAL